MTQNFKAPKLRFPGFTDDWEQRKLGELMDITSVKRIHQSDWTDFGVRFLRARDIVAGYKKEEISEPLFISEEKYNEYTAISGKVKIGDLLVTGVGTIGVPMLINSDKPLYFKDGNIIWFKNENTVDGKFLYFSFVNESIQKFIKESAGTGTVGTYTIDSGKKTPIYLPLQKDEQKKIGQFFSNLDNLITLHQRKFETLKKLKKGFLQKMFPKNGESVPEIRFPGFTDAWEQRKLGDIYQRNTERNTNLIDYSKTISVATMSFKDEGNGASEDSLSSYKVLRIGDIAFEGHTNKQFRFGRFVVNDIGIGIMSPRFSTLRPIGDLPVNFWKQYIHYEPIMRKVLVNATKAGTMMNELVIPEFLNQTILIPQNDEQKKIGDYFSKLDNLITLHQRKLDILKKLKQGMLQQMFI